MMDIDFIIGRLLQDLCPHNGIVSTRVKEQYPNHQLYFGDLSSADSHLQTAYSFHDHDPSALEYESWGDSATVEGIIAEVKKLNPRQLLEFRELKGKRERKEFLKRMDEAFEGGFRGYWSELCGLLFMYLRLDVESREEIEVFGGIIAADDEDDWSIAANIISIRPKLSKMRVKQVR